MADNHATSLTGFNKLIVFFSSGAQCPSLSSYNTIKSVAKIVKYRRWLTAAAGCRHKHNMADATESRRGLNIRKNAALCLDEGQLQAFAPPLSSTVKMAQMVSETLSQSAIQQHQQQQQQQPQHKESSCVSEHTPVRKLTRINTLSAHKPSWLRVNLRPPNQPSNEELNLNFAAELLQRWHSNQEASCPFVIGTQDFEMFRKFVRNKQLC